jgi:integrase
LAARQKGDTGKINGLVSAYKASDDFAKLADTTKRNWHRWLDRIRDYFGDLSIAQFDKPSIRVEIRKWHRTYKDTPRNADYGVQVLSKLLTFAMSEGLLGSNPCIGADLPKFYQSNRADIIWTKDDLEKLRESASPEIYRAAQLAALTGLRLTDLLKLTWSQIGDLSVERPTRKSKGRKTAIIPLYRELKAFLATVPKTGPTVLTNSRGQTWKGFGSSWNKVMHDSGLHERHLHFHDLRGTAATKLFMANLTVREIAQILAWSEDRVERLIDRYVKRDEILLDRIRRIDEGRR